MKETSVTSSTVPQEFLMLPQIIDHLWYSVSNHKEVQVLKHCVEEYGWDTVKQYTKTIPNQPWFVPELIEKIKTIDWDVLEVMADLASVEDAFMPSLLFDSSENEVNRKYIDSIIHDFLRLKQNPIDLTEIRTLTPSFRLLEKLNLLVEYYQTDDLYTADKSLLNIINTSFETCSKSLYNYHHQSAYQSSQEQKEQLEKYARTIDQFSTILEKEVLWDRFIELEHYLKIHHFELGDRKESHQKEYPFINLVPALFNEWAFQNLLTLLSQIKPCNLLKIGILNQKEVDYLTEMNTLQNAIKLIRTLQAKDQEQDQLWNYLTTNANENLTRFDEIRTAIYDRRHPEKVTFGAFRPFLENAVATDHLCDYLSNKQRGVAALTPSKLHQKELIDQIKAAQQQDPLWQLSENSQYDSFNLADLYECFCSVRQYQTYIKAQQPNQKLVHKHKLTKRK